MLQEQITWSKIPTSETNRYIVYKILSVNCIVPQNFSYVPKGLEFWAPKLEHCTLSFELHWKVDAVPMGTHNICLHKEVDKRYIGYNLKTTELLDCQLIGICAVIRANTVCFFMPPTWKTLRYIFLHPSAVCLMYQLSSQKVFQQGLWYLADLLGLWSRPDLHLKKEKD